MLAARLQPHPGRDRDAQRHRSHRGHLKLGPNLATFLLGLAAAGIAGAALLFWLRPVAAERAASVTGPSVLGPRVTHDGHFRTSVEPVQKPIAVGVTGPWLVSVRDRAGKLLRGCSVALDGWMPAHGHGLPTAPRMTRELDQGVYLIEGMRLSMPGAWELRLQVSGCGETDTAVFPLEL